MSVPGPVIGPCESWITADDVLACCRADVASSDDEAMLDELAVEASMLMWELSGRQYGGLCGPVKVRPCRQSCGCWGVPNSYGAGPWYWSYDSGLAAWGWQSECSDDKCGCGSTSYVRLAGYPVREIVEVKIAGVVLDPSEYALVGWRKLLRTTDPGPPQQPRSWPGCQDLGLEDDQPGTFSITYTHGQDPPLAGIRAAAEFACELYNACQGGACRLPSGIVQVVRQGVTFNRVAPIGEYLRAGATGLTFVDAFIGTYGGLRRRSAVFSPDLQPFARRDPY